MIKPELIPTINTPKQKQALDDLRLVDKVFPWIQIDVLDGTFAPTKTWHSASDFKKGKYKSFIELDLMVQDPKKVIKQWLSVKNFKRAIWHIEAPVDHLALIAFCRKHKLEVGLSLAPTTPARAILPYAKLIDEIMILGVTPGWSGQKLIPSTLKKISELKRLVPKLVIGFDGGITEQNLSSIIRQGVTRPYAHHLIFG